MFHKVISIYLSLLIIFTGIINPSISCAQDGKEYTLAVIDLVGYEVSLGEAKGLSDKLRSHISQIIRSDEYRYKQDKDQYVLVERAQMDKIFDQFDIQNVGCVSDSCAIEFGKMLQVDRIIIGSISLIGNTYSIIARTVDVETGKTVNSADRQYKGEIDYVLNSVIPGVGNDLILGPQRKSRRKWYIMVGAVVIGIAPYMILQDKDKEGSTTGTLIFNVPDLQDEP